MATTSEMLDSVRTAIASLETGAQEVTMADGRRVRYADLATLYARETALVSRLLTDNAGPAITRIKIGLGAGA